MSTAATWQKTRPPCLTGDERDGFDARRLVVRSQDHVKEASPAGKELRLDVRARPGLGNQLRLATVRGNTKDALPAAAREVDPIVVPPSGGAREPE